MHFYTLTLPYPISANRYWATRVIKRKGAKFASAMTYVTPEAEQYKEDVAKRALAAGIRQPIEGRIEFHVKLYPQRPQDWARRSSKNPDGWDDDVRCIDLGNCEKVLSDALNGIAWVDDKQHRRIILERCEPDGEARVVVTIKPLRVEPIAPQLFGDVAA